jgi:hypothetical protein
MVQQQEHGREQAGAGRDERHAPSALALNRHHLFCLLQRPPFEQNIQASKIIITTNSSNANRA